MLVRQQNVGCRPIITSTPEKVLKRVETSASTDSSASTSMLTSPTKAPVSRFDVSVKEVVVVTLFSYVLDGVPGVARVNKKVMIHFICIYLLMTLDILTDTRCH